MACCGSVWYQTLHVCGCYGALKLPDDMPALPADEPDTVMDAAALEQLVTGVLDENKANDILSVDLRGKSSVADVMIVASGRSQRHVGAVTDYILRALKNAGFGGARVEGEKACDWVLIDAGDVVVHLFRPEVRAFYNLEKLWGVESLAESAPKPAAEAS